jgi:hypothetical protein
MIIVAIPQKQRGDDRPKQQQPSKQQPPLSDLTISITKKGRKERDHVTQLLKQEKENAS